MVFVVFNVEVFSNRINAMEGVKHVRATIFARHWNSINHRYGLEGRCDSIGVDNSDLFVGEPEIPS